MTALARSLGLLLLIHGVADAAEVYRWTDEQGRLHFTERLDQVPPSQRDAARREALRSGVSNPVQTYSAPRDAERAAPGAGPRAGAVQIPFERQGSLMRVSAVEIGRAHV